MIDRISPAELARKQADGDSLAIIDVRTPMEFGEVHVPHAINLPLDHISVDAVRELSNSAPVYVICKSGHRASKACEQLLNAPRLQVKLVDGGTDGWIAAGLDVVRGKKVMSLERQVRLTAGLLVFIGTLLGFFLHAAWLALPALMGAGLAFAAITDSCAMGMFLARMPWNRR